MFKLLCFVLLFVLFGNGDAKFNFDQIREVINKNIGPNTTAMMIDASAKSLPNGLLRGNFYNFGSYDECLAIEDGLADIHGKYCYATLSIADALGLLSQKLQPSIEELERKKQNLMKKQSSMKPGSSIGFHFGVCVPNTLSTNDLNENIPLLVFDDSLCYPDEPKLETKHWIALAVLGTILVISLVSTLYDVTIRLLKKEPHTAIAAFSVYTNGKQLLKSSQNEDHLLCINGLRALNMIWVILGHVYVNFLISGAIDNVKDAFDWMDGVGNMGVMGATVSVDSFFTIGGLLTVYIYMKSADVDLKENVKSVPLMYLHRYLRLTPALAIIVMVYGTGLIKFLGNGPRWGLLQNLTVEGCENRWWSTLFYFQNYMSSSETMCIDQSWYLAVDMQLFLLSPLILIPLKKWPKYVLPIMVTLVGAGIAIPFWIGYSNKFTGLVLGSADPVFRSQYYNKTHTRFAPYVIGMLAGYLVHKMRSGGRKLKLHGVVSFILWVVAVLALVGCVLDGYGVKDDTSNAVYDGLFLGLNRSVWACAISLVIILCVSGNGGLINTFLSLPIMQFLSKLSYSMYLLHYFIITAVNLSRRDTVHFSNYEALFQFSSFLMVTVAVSVVYTLLFESPMIKLERLIFSRTRT